MPAKPTFTEEQREVLHAAALRVWRRFKADGKTQEDLALALGLSQQSVSALLKGTYNPGPRPATSLANLDGKTLHQLIGDFEPLEAAKTEHVAHHHAASGFANLDVCIRFHNATKHWSSWTIAAARAGFFGQTDFPPPEWASKLDALERVLEKARKVMPA